MLNTVMFTLPPLTLGDIDGAILGGVGYNEGVALGVAG